MVLLQQEHPAAALPRKESPTGGGQLRFCHAQLFF
jgi:hypothetical protein